ncbi:hypothetical protein BDB00DRAFT_237652 [Zychaea mexicana]|uniref:uncharacterized protein n=1 Tax=Zychaea mexicana TaxID=64656 RepID=UPI0022FF0A83|nr:uncharacterized protein BDB00DRAFT_237652 [Zychaea mexicana]KAI9495547.1 hypothetical protein BDB00DRAFT_237652 [Zychaea mexicana]
MHGMAADYEHVNLCDLSLQFQNPSNYYGFDPRPFLKATPGLRRLCLNIRYTRNTCALLPGFLREHCPELKTLIFYEYARPNEETSFHDRPVRNNDGATMIPSLTAVPERGLKHIVFQEQNYEGISPSILLPLIDEDTSKLLVSLDLDGPGIVNPEVMAHLSGFVFQSLQYLRLKGPYSRVTRSELCSFLQHSVPNLMHVSLHDIRYHRWDYPVIDDTVLATLASSTPRLESIGLECCYKVTGAGMLLFLERMSGQLRSITVEQCASVMTNKVMQFVAENMDTLDELTIDEKHSCLTATDIEKFLDIRRSGRTTGNDDSSKKKRHTIRRLNITFHFDHGYGTSYPGTAYLDHLFKKMDVGAKEWKFISQVSMDALNSIHHRGENAYVGEVNHISYRKKQLRYAPKTAYYESFKAIRY